MLNCPYHNDERTSETSLLRDHRCDVEHPPDTCCLVISNFDHEVWATKLSNSENQLACATRAHSIYILDLASKSTRKIKDAHKKDINALCWNKTDSRLVSAGSDFLVNIYCTKQCELLIKISAHKSVVLASVFNPLTGHIYTGGVDNWIGIWSDSGSYVLISLYHPLQLDYIETKIVKNLHFTKSGLLMIVHYASQTYLGVFDTKTKPKLAFKFSSLTYLHLLQH